MVASFCEAKPGGSAKLVKRRCGGPECVQESGGARKKMLGGALFMHEYASGLRPSGLYDPWDTRASCGVGAIVNVNGRADHRVVTDALGLLENLDHRGARGAEVNTGDGSGVMLKIPVDFFRREIPSLGETGQFATGMMFLSRDADQRERQMSVVNQLVGGHGFAIKSWRRVPVHNRGLGRTALDSEPAVFQFFCTPSQPENSELSVKDLYLLRRAIEKHSDACLREGEMFSLCSLDTRIVVYKGLLTCHQLRRYYPDLQHQGFISPFAIVHNRFSTNTLGTWWLAQPFQYCAHNGEFNSLRGNMNWMRAREHDLANAFLGEGLTKALPIVESSRGLSDSAIFDRVLSLLVAGGRSLPHALRMMIPPAWRKDVDMTVRERDFYDYHSRIIEPWDGPALVVASDGRRVGAIMDCNGLRPCRYVRTNDGRIIIASESGAVRVPPDDIVHKDRLAPGDIFVVDTAEEKVSSRHEVLADLIKPNYTDWISAQRADVHDLVEATGSSSSEELLVDNLTALQRAFGYSVESIQNLMLAMVDKHADPVGAMGNDAPIAALSLRARDLSDYFVQSFAQVSNPAIDYLRESLVMSLDSYLGSQGNLLEEGPAHAGRLRLDTPALRPQVFKVLCDPKINPLRVARIEATYPTCKSLKEALDELRESALAAVCNGAELLIVSDRLASEQRKPIPSLLATGAIHHHLIRKGVRTRTSLVAEAGDVHLVHQLATNIGYGADAVYPWLAFATLAADRLTSTEWSAAAAIENYCQALEDGLLKVMAKIGISSLESYKGAQLFEAIGLEETVLDEYFEGTRCAVSGLGLDQIESDVDLRHGEGFRKRIAGEPRLEEGGHYYWRRDGEAHRWNPKTIALLQHAVRTGDETAYRQYCQCVNANVAQPSAVRDLFAFAQAGRSPIAIAQVETEEKIMKRFSTGSMSFGSLSREAHESLALAMNEIGGVSGTGEGGEQVDRFGTNAECSMKQIASGRFGVTLEYLSRAQQIEIKMAQGAKPGEGGELPGAKVNDEIAQVRLTRPGIGLISPPPHHDIYSIEDLAQLIHDLRCVNPNAEIQVKLVSRQGVGTIAAGVAKAGADSILISGGDGGTGAAKKTSIKHAGTPWELGLAEAHQVLVASRLRSRVVLRVDGGMMSGRDLIIATLLGADAYGIGTAALVSLGCIMLRKCHCNTCSVGIATQRSELRKYFAGRPEHVLQLMRFLASEMREIMAELGFQSVSEMRGQANSLMLSDKIAHPKLRRLNFSRLFHVSENVGWSEASGRSATETAHRTFGQVDDQLWGQVEQQLQRGCNAKLRHTVTNVDRAVGTLISHRIVRGGLGPLADDRVTITLTGVAGQSLGAFLAKGVTLKVKGECNDYVGKGLSGGKIIVQPAGQASSLNDSDIAVGNVCLYGATAGQLFVRGCAGERFAVRNSGASAVVEGVGDHGCEYMTGGVVLVLGSVGRNFAAGMTGGEVYLATSMADVKTRLGGQHVVVLPCGEADFQVIEPLLRLHSTYTKSSKAEQLLASWRTDPSTWCKVIPFSALELESDEGTHSNPAMRRDGATRPIGEPQDGPAHTMEHV